MDELTIAQKSLAPNPGPGTVGAPVQVSTNHWEIKRVQAFDTTKLVIYQYSLDTSAFNHIYGDKPSENDAYEFFDKIKNAISVRDGIRYVIFCCWLQKLIFYLVWKRGMMVVLSSGP